VTVHAPIILKNYEEAVGVLRRLVPDGGSLLAEIGPISVALPSDLEGELRPLLGQRVGVLRVDTGKPYRVRAVAKRFVEEGKSKDAVGCPGWSN